MGARGEYSVKPLFLALLAALGASAPACGDRGPASRSEVVILAPSAANDLLHPCSREAPTPWDDVWTPTLADVAKVEAMVPAAFEAEQLAKASGGRRPPQGWARYYTGLVRGGDRFIYGGFYPREIPGAPNFPGYALTICDGGPTYFAVEYDMKSGRISTIAFDGEFAEPAQP